MTLLLMEGETVNLIAHSEDEDTLSDGTTSKNYGDAAEVIWTATGGAKFKPERTKTDDPSTLTLPMIPPGMDSISFTATAQADDQWTANPGGGLMGYGGNRNDDPGASVTISVKVVKSGPTTVNIVYQEPVPFVGFAAFWPKVYPRVQTFGGAVAQHKVSGGTPPDPPKNWNGLFVREQMRLHPIDPGNAKDEDFVGGVSLATFSTTTSDGFVVGSGGVLGYPDGTSRSYPPADNTFWDHIGFGAGRPDLVLKEGLPDKTVRAEHTYWCKTTQLTPKFVTATTIRNASVPYKDATGTEVMVRVNEVTVAHTAE